MPLTSMRVYPGRFGPNVAYGNAESPSHEASKLYAEPRTLSDVN